ncbi:dihydroxy-acid dehydratase, partial [Burkholderia contaminans]|nr:dihydroxy-acid dehydratase [Burkholderia contaminans]
TDKDFETSIVGVISTWAENTPCNIHLHDFGKLAKEGVKSAGAWPVQFGTITVADGIAKILHTGYYYGSGQRIIL